MKEKNVTIETMQELVSEMVKRYGLETTPELRYVDLTTEVGELGKELLKGSDYGKKTLEKTDNLESEMGDTLFSLTCIANSLNIDLQTALVNAMKKYQKRFNEKGSIGSEEIEIDKLVEAMKSFLSRKELEKPLKTKITNKEYSVKERKNSIRNIIRNKKRVEFTELFEEYNKSYIAVTFLSVLELAKEHELKISQDKNFDNIFIEGAS